ncbi:uncharacterized protein EKO05_0008382 [Ascochyta rabiei]|uniref:uncharacterized protein n=1 Tax=Didymella rabiei TaxID=5454 RepID=UPI0021FE7248|nr:uncharacterized protein EKO05_0008382 [Ascochyta rabiei]UPX18065.1 hypothetical protein EKO05_0008382 [Ascochyta rabiei]
MRRGHVCDTKQDGRSRAVGHACATCPCVMLTGAVRVDPHLIVINPRVAPPQRPQWLVLRQKACRSAVNEPRPAINGGRLAGDARAGTLQAFWVVRDGGNPRNGRTSGSGRLV